MIEILIGIAIALLVTWVVLIGFLLMARPKGDLFRESIRLLPDTLRLLKRLASAPDVPASVKVRLWLLFLYLASPIDLVPDFVPIIGYADDAVLVAAVLRSAARRSGVDTLRRHWPGTEQGFTSLVRLAGLKPE